MDKNIPSKSELIYSAPLIDGEDWSHEQQPMLRLMVEPDGELGIEITNLSGNDMEAFVGSKIARKHRAVIDAIHGAYNPDNQDIYEKQAQERAKRIRTLKRLAKIDTIIEKSKGFLKYLLDI